MNFRLGVLDICLNGYKKNRGHKPLCGFLEWVFRSKFRLFTFNHLKGFKSIVSVYIEFAILYYSTDYDKWYIYLWNQKHRIGKKLWIFVECIWQNSIKQAVIEANIFPKQYNYTNSNKIIKKQSKSKCLLVCYFWISLWYEDVHVRCHVQMIRHQSLCIFENIIDI